MAENKNKTYGYETVTRKKFAVLRIIDLYVLKEFIIIYLCTLFAFNMLFLISNLINKMGDMIDAKATFFQSAYYFMLKQPQAIVFVLPITLLLSCMYAMAKLGMNNEITAMRASGISLFRCGFSIYCVGFLVTCVHFIFTDGLAPECTREALIYRKTLSVGPDYLRNQTRMLMYRSPNNQRTWLVEDFVSKKEQKDVQIKRYDEEGVLEAELSAKVAKYTSETGWQFYDADYVKYQGLQLKKAFSAKTIGQKKEIIVPVTKHYKIVDSSSPIYKELGNITETPTDIFNSIKPPEEMPSSEIIRVLRNSQDLPPQTTNLYKTLLYSRYAMPWVCLFSVFLGVPLAGSNERRGIMMSVISAIGVIVVYTVVSQVFNVLGNRGYLPAFIAGTGPTIVLFGYIVHKVLKQK
jgi:lipopolysaccharide export system permease protein